MFFQFYVFCAIIALRLVAARQRFLSFSDCHDIYDVTGEHSYRISWSGYNYLEGCRVSFHGYDSFNPLNKYQVCIIATNWTVKNPGLTLNYFAGKTLNRGDLNERYDQYKQPTDQWCSEQDHYVDVLLHASSAVPSHQSSVILEVTARMSYSYKDSGKWIGGTMAAIIILVLFCLVAFFNLKLRMCLRGNKSQLSTNRGRAAQTFGTTNQGYQHEPDVFYPSNAPISYIKSPPPYTATPPPPYSSLKIETT